MTSQSSNEERNRLRLQAWEQRNQGSSQAKEQNLENVPLFGHPYKTNKGDELSNRIQRMLGSFDDNTTTEPFTDPSSSTFPLTNSLHPIFDPPYKSPKGSCANPFSRRDFNSPKCQNVDESQAIGQDSQLIRPSSQKKPAHHEKTFAADVHPLPFPHSELHSLGPKDSPFTTPDEPQYHGSTDNTSGSWGNSMQFFTKGTSSPLNRTFSVSHSQAFNLPLSNKQTNAAMMQKPTAYVRPMDGPEVVTESPELKPSPKHRTRLPDIIRNKSIQGKASTLPQFLETLTSEIQCVEHILSEMTCSWPPLLSGIHSPRAPKAQSSVKATEENPSKQEHGQISSDPPLSHQSSSVDSESDSKSGANDPSVGYSPRSEPSPVLMPSGDWQLDKLIHFRQENYRSQRAAPPSPKFSSLNDLLKQSSVSVFGPERDTSNLLSLNQKTVSFPTLQLFTTQENHDHQSSHKPRSTSSPSESPLPTDPVKQTPQNQNGGVSVHFDQTASQEQEPGLKETPKVERHKQSKNENVFENEGTTDHNKNKDKKAFKYDQCTACMNSNNSSQSTYSDHITPACTCGKTKAEAKHKKVAKLLQKDKCLNGCSQDRSKDTLSLIVKINLNLLSKIPQMSESLQIQHCTKDDKPHQVTNSRKNDKGDQHSPKKKQKLQGNNPSLNTARLENSNPSEATGKRSKEKDEMSLASSALRDCSQKCKNRKQYCGNAPQLNKEEVKCPNNPRRNSGHMKEEATATKPVRESSSNRPLLSFEDRHYPVKHYIKEAKRLKHKADAEICVQAYKLKGPFSNRK